MTAEVKAAHLHGAFKERLSTPSFCCPVYSSPPDHHLSMAISHCPTAGLLHNAIPMGRWVYNLRLIEALHTYEYSSKVQSR